MADKMNTWQSLGLQRNCHTLPDQFSSYSIIISNEIASFPPPCFLSWDWFKAKLQKYCCLWLTIVIVIESSEVTYTSQYRIHTGNTTIIHCTDTHTFIMFESIKKRTDQNMRQKIETHILGLGRHTRCPWVLKMGFWGYLDFRFRILQDLASTYVLRWPCSSSLYFGISQSSGWLDLVMSEERNLSRFQNWRIVYMNEGLIY